MEYGIAAWATEAKANMDCEKRIQNQADSIMTGGMKSTPIKKRAEITKIQPMEERNKDPHTVCKDQAT
jgi:hypothetical protein